MKELIHISGIAIMFQQTLKGQALLFLDIMGLGPLVSAKGAKARAVLFLIFEGITGVLLIMGMLFTAEDYYDALTNVTALTTVYQTITKSVVLLRRRQNILEGINFLARFWELDRYGDMSKKKMVYYQLLVRIVLRTFRIFGIITASLYLSKPLLEGKRALPMLCYPLCDMKSNSCYIFHYILLVVSLACQCVTLMGFDGLFFTLLMCAYSEVEQIKYALHNLRVEENEVNQGVLNEMTAVVEHHNLVLEYISKFDGLFQVTLLHQFGATLLSYCSGLFLLTVSGFPPSAGEFLRSGIYVACVFLQILIYCAVGEKLAEQILRGSMSMLAFMQAVYRTRN